MTILKLRTFLIDDDPQGSVLYVDVVPDDGASDEVGVVDVHVVALPPVLHGRVARQLDSLTHVQLNAATQLLKQPRQTSKN